MTVAAFTLGCIVAFAAGWLARELYVAALMRPRRRGGDVDLVGARPRSVRYFDPSRTWELPRIEAETRPPAVDNGRVVPLAPLRLARGDDE